MSNIPLEKRILYSNIFCTHRETLPNKIACKHPYSFGTCDLDLCPIAQTNFANIVFLPEGITLVVKEPSKEKVAGEWRKIVLEINLDNEDEIIDLVKKETKNLTDKNMNALIERIHRIYERYRFLREKGIEIPILEEKLEEEELEEIPEVEAEEEEVTEEELEEYEEEYEEEEEEEK